MADTQMLDAVRVSAWNLRDCHIAERHGDDACLVGFTTFHGSVTAARDWDAPAERRRVRPALDGSVEALFHRAGVQELLPSAPRRPRGRCAPHAAAGARHRRRLPSRSRAGEPLLPRRPRRAVRCGGPLRPHPRAAPPGAHAGVYRRRGTAGARATGNLSDGAVRGGTIPAVVASIHPVKSSRGRQWCPCPEGAPARGRSVSATAAVKRSGVTGP